MQQPHASVKHDSPEPTLANCPICGGDSLEFLFVGQGTPLVECESCGLLMRNPQPTDERLSEIYSSSYFLGSTSEADHKEMLHLKQQTARRYLDEIGHFAQKAGLSTQGLALLEIGCGHGTFLVEARARGYRISGVELSASAVETANRLLGEPCVLQGTIEALNLSPGSFDVCVLADVLEHTRDPAAFLSQVYACLRPGGILFVAIPSLDSWSARLMRTNWMEFKTEHLFYFNRETARNLLFRSGFLQIEEKSGVKILNMRYIVQHFDRFYTPLITPLMRALRWLTPNFIQRRSFPVVASGIVLVAQRSPEPPPSRRRHKLSVVLPVFNEAKTFQEVMDQLLAKQFDNMELEVILVESNSTDGSREQVLTYQGRPGVQVILEERPRGKGHAVRNGLAHATGDFILIQDADLEYDLNDYEHLLLPLRRYRKAFVLGSRHSGNSWKIRHFEDQVATSSMMNLGHVFFATLFNVLYGQRLKDPFTMYKVFRRDCLHDLAFEGNRFDFDCELVAKLVRRGYHPIEIPVNYQSRSFAEGKKISFFRDPPTYLRAFVKYRFIDLDKEKARERTLAKRA